MGCEVNDKNKNLGLANLLLKGNNKIYNIVMKLATLSQPVTNFR